MSILQIATFGVHIDEMVSDKEVRGAAGEMGKHKMMQTKALLKISMAGAFVEESGICL